MIGENAVVCTGSSIGARVVIGPNAVIGRPGFGWAPGPEGRVRRIPQLGGVVIEDDVEIGALSTVDAGTLSPTFIGTVYGMNFKDMPELQWAWGYPFAWAMMLGSAAACVAFLVSRRWI